MMPQADWRARLSTLVQNMRRSERPVEYPFRRMFELVDAPAPSMLNDELTGLVGRGELKAVYRVRSRETGAGLAEYKSIIDIPKFLYDDTADRMQSIDLGRDVELIYRVAK